jgi:hypothetical protein
MELCAPFNGWNIDVEGIIHTACGYRCTPQQIEAVLWLTGSLRWDLGKRAIFADTPLVEPRRMHETRDLELPPANPIRVQRRCAQEWDGNQCTCQTRGQVSTATRSRF